jgi:hypothetical protein
MNRLNLTLDAIRSIQEQTYAQWQLWLVDDGSTDATYELLHEAFVDDLRIHLTRIQHAGVSAARQFAVEQGHADWVALLDSDDLWTSTKLEKQLAVAQGVDLVLCWFDLIDASGKVRKGERLRGEGLVSPLFTSNMSTPLIRRELIERVGGLGPQPGLPALSTCEVTEFYLRALPQSAVRVVQETLVICREHSGPRASDNITSVGGAREMDALITYHWHLLEAYPEGSARLVAGSGARYIAAGEWRLGGRRLRQAIKMAPFGVKFGISVSYLPFMASHAWSFLRSRSSHGNGPLKLQR